MSKRNDLISKREDNDSLTTWFMTCEGESNRQQQSSSLGKMHVKGTQKRPKPIQWQKRTRIKDWEKWRNW